MKLDYNRKMQDTDAKYGLLLGHLADNIRAARLKNNLRQSDMIEFGFSERFIQKLESGKYSPNLYTIHRLALALKVPISKLFKVSTNSEDR